MHNRWLNAEFSTSSKGAKIQENQELVMTSADRAYIRRYSSYIRTDFHYYVFDKQKDIEEIKKNKFSDFSGYFKNGVTFLQYFITIWNSMKIFNFFCNSNNTIYLLVG